MAEFAERIELLRRVRLFSGLTQDDLEAVNELLEEKRFRKGTVIFEQGDEGDALYIIESGRLKAAIKDEEGREKVLGVFGEGDYFGEMALLSDQPRSASMTVVGDAELLTLRKEIFERFLASNIGVMRQFVSLMSRRLAETNTAVATGDDTQQKQVLGRTIVVFSPKGGIGKTTLVVNLATVLREQTGKSVVIVDCAYPFGDVGVMMNLEPRRTVIDLLPHTNELDGPIIDSILQTHPSGTRVLLAPSTPEESELVTAEHINIVISALRELYEFIIIDTQSTFTEVSIGALDTADLVLVMTTLELPALKSVRQFMDTATQKLGYPVEKLAVVVNRASPVGGLTLADVETLTGAKVVASISSNGPIAVAAANQGVPFVISNKDSQIYRDVLALAKLISPLVVDADAAEEFEDDEETPPLAERVRRAPRRIYAAARGGIASLEVMDMLTGLGSTLAVSSPFLLLFALLGFMAQKMNQNFPANPTFWFSVWAGIVGGTFLITRLQQPRKAPWVLGAILGASYGLVMSFASIAVLAIAGGSVNTPIFMVIFLVIPFALMGIAGTYIAERTRPRTQTLLS